MKRTILAPEQKKFFQINGFITFDALVSLELMEEMWKQLLKRRKELPGLTHENISRSIPHVMTIARKLGHIAGALLDRKPIRFAYDSFIEDLNEVKILQDREVGLLLSESGKGYFFTNPSHLYNLPKTCYLLIVFTANYVNNPIVYHD